MERSLDVSELEPPEPMERILAALDGMPAGDWLRVTHRREPFSLYNLLRNMDFAWHSRWLGDQVVLLIWREGHPPPGIGGARC